MATQGTKRSVYRGYNSFSGVDIKGVFANQVIAELQAISYSVTREKAPVYTMGSADPRAFSRGKRGIAGTLVFIMFDRHGLLGAMGQYADPGNQLFFLSDKDDLRPEAGILDPGNLTGVGIQTVDASLNSPEAQIAFQESNISNVRDDQVAAAAWYVDQLPPFDITLAAANEYGSLAVMRIYGVELMNEGYGVSIDDIVSEIQNTYIARTMVPWRPAGSVSLTNGGRSDGE